MREADRGGEGRERKKTEWSVRENWREQIERKIEKEKARESKREQERVR